MLFAHSLQPTPVFFLEFTVDLYIPSDLYVDMIAAMLDCKSWFHRRSKILLRQTDTAYEFGKPWVGAKRVKSRIDFEILHLQISLGERAFERGKRLSFSFKLAYRIESSAGDT